MVVNWTPELNRTIFLDTDNTRQGETCPNREHVLPVEPRGRKGRRSETRLVTFPVYLPEKSPHLPGAMWVTKWRVTGRVASWSSPIRKDVSEGRRHSVSLTFPRSFFFNKMHNEFDKEACHLPGRWLCSWGSGQGPNSGSLFTMTPVLSPSAAGPGSPNDCIALKLTQWFFENVSLSRLWTTYVNSNSEFPISS